MTAPTACGHTGVEAETLFDAQDPATGDAFTIIRCRRCDLAQTAPAPTDAELDGYYPRGYHSTTKRYRGGIDRVLSMVHRSRIRSIERLVGGPGSVLDVGCGPGVLINQMRSRGWRVRGTERSPSAAQQARDVFHLDVGAVDVDELVAAGATYDAVVLWHVAEHLHSPAATVRGIARLLRPGGVLLIAVPNFGSPEARVGRAGWFHLDVPRHLVHFTPSTLTAILDAAGFRPVKVTHLVPEYDLFSFVQTVENRLGLPPNLLYDVLRRPEARLRRQRSGRLQEIVAVGTAVPLSIAAVVIAPLAAAARRSATIAVYAVRLPDQRE
ncbi:MAG TPA: class I SAM-dependent methyltransferase [Candidatus Saccharimonadales bacterium]|nr:class I SAM-dependent methyltransferase [Candidatus Saccharimonadales bacterium]